MNIAAKRLRDLAEQARGSARTRDESVIHYSQLLAEAREEADKYRALAAEYEAAANRLDPPAAPEDTAAAAEAV